MAMMMVYYLFKMYVPFNPNLKPRPFDVPLDSTSHCKQYLKPASKNQYFLIYCWWGWGFQSLRRLNTGKNQCFNHPGGLDPFGVQLLFCRGDVLLRCPKICSEKNIPARSFLPKFLQISREHEVPPSKLWGDLCCNLHSSFPTSLPPRPLDTVIWGRTWFHFIPVDSS